MTLVAPQLLAPRAVPLGGIRALPVRRTLPQRGRSLIGAWCFLDHYGPTTLTTEAGMSVPRHPHTGLQTVSWLFAGAIDHCDSAGHTARVQPGELNLMTAGHGITHSEFATNDTTLLHGVQLWLALPDVARDTSPGLSQYQPDTVSGTGWTAQVALGTLLTSVSPVHTFTPTVLAEINLAPHTTLELTPDQGFSPSYEYGVLVDQGVLTLNEIPVSASELAYIDTGGSGIKFQTGVDAAKLILLGGTPLNERIVMWWNFVGRTHEDIVAAREDYMRELSDPRTAHNGPRFGPFPVATPAALPAPTLPRTRLIARGV